MFETVEQIDVKITLSFLKYLHNIFIIFSVFGSKIIIFMLMNYLVIILISKNIKLIRHIILIRIISQCIRQKKILILNKRLISEMIHICKQKQILNLQNDTLNFLTFS